MWFPQKIMTISFVIALLAIVALVSHPTTAAPASPQVLNLTFEPVEDAYIMSDQPSTRPGQIDAGNLKVGLNSANGIQRTLIKFDLSTLPATSKIISASLVLYPKEVSPSGDGPMAVEARAIFSPWSSFFVSWSNAPSYGPVRSNANVPGSVNTAVSWDVKDLVNDWVKGTVPNYGLILLGDENNQRLRNFYSHDDNVFNGFKPRLYVEYDPDSIPPTLTLNSLPQYSPFNFTVSWVGNDTGGSGLKDYDIEYRRDGGAWTLWLDNTTATSAEFTIGIEPSVYEFRGRATDNAQNVGEYSNTVSTIFGIAPPVSTMQTLPAISQSSPISVIWLGTTVDGSGIQDFDVYYRFNEGAWTLWLDATTVTSANFSPPAGDGFYEFTTVATAYNGLTEAMGGPKAHTIFDATAPFVEPQDYLPIIRR